MYHLYWFKQFSWNLEFEQFVLCIIAYVLGWGSNAADGRKSCGPFQSWQPWWIHHARTCSGKLTKLIYCANCKQTNNTQNGTYISVQILALFLYFLLLFHNTKGTNEWSYLTENIQEKVTVRRAVYHYNRCQVEVQWCKFEPWFLQVVQDTIDPNAKIEFRPNTEDDPHKRKPDISKAKELLGWEPNVSLRKGLPLMVADFRHRIFGDPRDNQGGSTTFAWFSRTVDEEK